MKAEGSTVGVLDEDNLISIATVSSVFWFLFECKSKSNSINLSSLINSDSEMFLLKRGKGLNNELKERNYKITLVTFVLVKFDLKLVIY